MLVMGGGGLRGIELLKPKISPNNFLKLLKRKRNSYMIKTIIVCCDFVFQS